MDSDPLDRPAAVFEETLWSQVCLAGAGSHQALDKLYRKYWYPIYAYLRRSGKSPEESEDLTQGFFLHLHDKDLIRKADQGRGRFRSFLLGVLKNFVRDRKAHDQAVRRGGGTETVPLEMDGAEAKYLAEPATVDEPEKLMDRRWALEVVNKAVARLQTEFAAAGRAGEFEAYRPFLTCESEEKYAELADRLKITEGNARVQMCRLRERFNIAIRREIADTVENPALIGQELESLRAALRNN